MYWFGHELSSLDAVYTDESWRKLSTLRESFYQIQLEKVIALLDAFSSEWTPSSSNYQEALPFLISESGFSKEETIKTLGLLSGLLKKESLMKRLRAEFTHCDVLDRFTKLPHQSALVKAIPVGTILHVTAGNVFLSSIDSLLMGFLTKNLSIVKVSGQNTFFPLFFARKLKEFDKQKILSDKLAILHWKGGNQRIEDFMKSKVNLILAWGGEEMLASYRKDLSPHVKLLDFGPKISLQVISKEGLNNRRLEQVAQKVVEDITPWDQGACASPQNLYLEEGVDAAKFIKCLELAFANAPLRGEISEDEATEILKEKYRAYYSDLMQNGEARSGENYLIHLEQSKVLRPSPLNRSVIIKRYKDRHELSQILLPFSYYLQSCSYLLGDEEKSSYLESLALTGIKRFAPLGTITWGMEGAPHDGRFVLRELVTFISDENRVSTLDLEQMEIQDAKKMKSFFDQAKHPEGYIFSSGGTTGEPKFVHFSYEEFDFMSDMLADNFRRQGIKRGMVVANLFVAGNLWSSFMCVEKALEKIGTIQLPIGGLCSPENVLLYIKKFKPDVVLGIPSMLVMCAEFMASKQESVTIPMVFYAGEAMSQIRREYLEKIWGTKYFGSAGYASVDAGVIGYQCKDCGPGEHHVFSDHIELKIIEDEAVVTCSARSSMPIKNYQTGDRIEWIEDCSCGSSEKRFKILGRVDNVIQIWSCRLLSTDIELSLSESGILTYQIKILESREANVVREKLKILIEKNGQFDQEKMLLDLYQRSRDVKDTISFGEFKKDIIIETLSKGEIPRNSRTGKISLVLDERR